MRNVLKPLLLSLVLGAGVLAEPSVLTGKFVELQMGDYAHVEILDGAGKSHNFWLGNDPSLAKIVEHPDWYQGKKVKVTWQKVNRNIPEAGGSMEIEEVSKIEVIK